MQLTDTQTDALTELINIGHGRAAAALSQMTGYRVNLEVPSVSVVSLADVSIPLTKALGESVLCVNQAFSGVLSGNAMLLVDQESGRLLSRLLEPELHGDQEQATRDVLTEAGNVLLNACLGAFGNLLEVQISFAVPTLSVNSVSGILRSVNICGEQLTHAVIARTKFHISNSQVTGVMMIVVGLTSLECVLRSLDDWQRS